MKLRERKNNLLKQWIIGLLCVILMLGVLTSCTKSDGMIAEDVEMEPAENASGTAKPEGGDRGDVSQSVTRDSADEEMPKKVIRNAAMTAESKNFDDALAEIEESLEALEGYVESSELTGKAFTGQTGGNRCAVLSMRIPAERLDEFLEKTGTLVNVVSSSTTAEDVSSQYYDIEARLSVLETERQVLEEMLAKSNSVSDMITVEIRLYDVIYEIESYKTQLKLYDSMVAYSTVKLTLREVTDLTVVAKNNTFGARLKQAIGETWQNFAEFCKEALIWLIYAMPTLILLGAVGTAGAIVAVRTVKKKKQDRAEAKNGDTEE